MKERRITCFRALCIVALVGGCHTDDGSESVDPLPPVVEMDLVTPDEAALTASAEITAENVDAEFEKLLRELEAEED